MKNKRYSQLFLKNSIRNTHTTKTLCDIKSPKVKIQLPKSNFADMMINKENKSKLQDNISPNSKPSLKCKTFLNFKTDKNIIEINKSKTEKISKIENYHSNVIDNDKNDQIKIEKNYKILNDLKTKLKKIEEAKESSNNHGKFEPAIFPIGNKDISFKNSNKFINDFNSKVIAINSNNNNMSKKNSNTNIRLIKKSIVEDKIPTKHNNDSSLSSNSFSRTLTESSFSLNSTPSFSSNFSISNISNTRENNLKEDKNKRNFEIPLLNCNNKRKFYKNNY